MKDNSARIRTVPMVVAALIAFCGMRALPGAAQTTFTPANLRTVNLFVTNQVQQSITNVIEVRMPFNVFVDQYRTNWIEQLRTNIVDVYNTNWLEKTLTNTTIVERTQTNLINLTLTNWQVVLVMRTNWVTQAATNMVQVDLPAATSGSIVATTELDAERAPRPEPINPSQNLMIEATRTQKPANNNRAEVRLALKSESDLSAVLQVQEWRLERSDGTMLVFGPLQELTTELSPGTYKVTVKTRRGEKSPLIIVKGTVEISQDGGIHRPTASLLSFTREL